MVTNQILISVGLLVMLEVYLSWSFCDKCPRPQLLQSHGNQEDEGDSHILSPPHAKYLAPSSRAPQSPVEREETIASGEPGRRHRSPREAPRVKRGHNRRKNRQKDRRSQNNGRQRQKTTADPTSDSQRNISNVCNICWMRERRRDHRIESIKSAVLEKLEMTQAPNVSRVTLPESLPPGIFGQDVFNNRSSPPETPNDSNIDFQELDGAVQIVQFARPPPPEVNLGDSYLNTSIVYFKLDSEVRKLHHAILYLYVLPRRPPHYVSRGTAFISIYQIIRGRNNRTIHRPQPDMRTQVDLNQLPNGGWKEVNVKRIVQRWIHHPTEENLGLYVVATGPDGETFLVLNPENEDDNDNRPCLKTQLTERKNTRSKRRLGENMNCVEKSTESRCCRYPLLVDFDEFGWEWIVQPRQYRAYYCAGNCPYAFKSVTPHAHVVGSILDYELGGPCCTPTAMSAISMIYYDEGFRMKKRTLEDMVVDNCGCK